MNPEPSPQPSSASPDSPDSPASLPSPQPPKPSSSIRQSNVTISILARDLNIYTLQGVATSETDLIVPNLDGQLLRVRRDGNISVLVDLYKAELGIPFGIVEHGGDWVVTVSGYLPVHYLVRVKPDGRYTEIANLSQTSGFYGAPFGVAMDGRSYVVTVSTDVVSSKSMLIRISAAGFISKIADLSKFGLCFSVVLSQGGYVVAQEKGQLLRVMRDGKVSLLVDLLKSGFGVPLGIARDGSDFIVTTNSGLIAQVAADGTPSKLVDLAQERLGVPSGVVLDQGNLVVTTNSGYLLQITR